MMKVMTHRRKTATLRTMNRHVCILYLLRLVLYIYSISRSLMTVYRTIESDGADVHILLGVIV